MYCTHKRIHPAYIYAHLSDKKGVLTLYARENHALEHPPSQVFANHAFVGVNSATTAVATPATMATTPKTTMNIGKKNFRVVHSRSPSAGLYCEELLVHTANARRISPWLYFKKSSAGSTYPTVFRASINHHTRGKVVG